MLVILDYSYALAYAGFPRMPQGKSGALKQSRRADIPFRSDLRLSAGPWSCPHGC